MFERYTERARRVLFFARYEASQLGSVSIETEHLLLGLIREGKGFTSRIFARHALSLDTVRRQIEAKTVYREKISTSVEIPFSQETKRVLHVAADEADSLLHNYIGTEHLLLALLREERSVAGALLAENRLRLEDVRKDVVELISSGHSDETADVHADPHRGSLHDLPQYLPSHTVHFSVSRRSVEATSTGPRHWIAAGSELGRVMALAYGVDESHLILPASLARHMRLDVVLVLPSDTETAQMTQVLRHAIEKQFAVSATRESGPGGEVVVVRPNAE